MVSTMLSFRNLYSSKPYLSRRFSGITVSIRALSLICGWNIVHDTDSKDLTVRDSLKLLLACPYGRRSILLQSMVLPPNNDNNTNEESEIGHRHISKKRYSEKSSLIADSTLCRIARLFHHQEEVPLEAVEISNLQEESSTVLKTMKERAVELRSAVFSGQPLQPSCSPSILHYSLKTFHSQEAAVAATTSESRAGNLPDTVTCETLYSYYVTATGGLITEENVEVQAWIDCCFLDSDRAAVAGGRLTADSDSELRMIERQCRQAFIARGGCLVSCERQFVSDVLLRLRGESFVFQITRCWASTTLGTSDKAIRTESASVIIPLSYLYSAQHGIVESDLYATTSKNAARAIETLSPYELFDFYRAESIALVKYRSQLLKDTKLLTRLTQPVTTSSYVRPSSPRPTTFRMKSAEGSFVAIYDHLLPSSSTELPLSKISAVFADRTILQWSVEHPQVLSALLPDGSEQVLSIEAYYKGDPHLFRDLNAMDTATAASSILYHYSGQLLSFANIARTPEEERREMKHREEEMADKVAAVLAQGRRYLAVSSLMDRTGT